MKFRLLCASTYDAESIIGKYPLIRKYNPKVYYTCSCREARIMITVNKDQLLAFYKDVGKPIIIDASDDPEDHNMLTLTIYDDWIE